MIDVEDFFDPILTPPAQTVLYDPKAPSRYEGNSSGNRCSERVCKTFRKLCGSKGTPYSDRVKLGCITRKAPHDIDPVFPYNAVSYDLNVIRLS